MNRPTSAAPVPATAIVEETIEFTLDELGRATHTSTQWLLTLVDEGVLAPLQRAPQPPDWRFSGDALRRARRAARLARDFELDLHGVALALDLLDQIERLQQRLAAAGLRD